MSVEPQRLVAICDVMGFSNLVQKYPIEKIISFHLKRLFAIVENSITQEEPQIPYSFIQRLRSEKRVGVAWFSDTIMLYALDDSDQSCANLIETVGWLIFKSFFDAPETRIRVGIGYGTFFADEERNLFVGSALIDAYQVEAAQNWTGGALSKSACNRIQAIPGFLPHNWIRAYAIPTKSGCKIESIGQMAVDWTFGFHEITNIPWSKTSSEPSDEERGNMKNICEKWQNTKTFHRQACRWCRAEHVPADT